MKNLDIRSEIKKTDVRHWQVAERYGIHEGNFSRLLRRELPNETKLKILDIIKDLQKEGREV